MTAPPISSPLHLEPQRVTLDTVQLDPFYDISLPVDPDARLRRAEAFSPFPLMVVSPTGILLAGYDFYRLSLSRGDREALVMSGDLSKKEALFLGYTVNNALFSLNLAEKLLFVQRILQVADPSEVYRKVTLDITINQDLITRLDLLSESRFQRLLAHDGVNLKTALRICDLEEKDRETAIALFQRVPFTSSQCLHLLEMVEEIAFRDKSTLGDILTAIDIDALMQLKKPQPTILQAIGKLRFPLSVRAEEEWRRRIEALNLPGHIKINHAPFFEKKSVEITSILQNPDSLEAFLKKITED